MYQAIVFLPLLGAILAGLIALAGARVRFPGKGPAPGGEDHAPTMMRTIAARSVTPRIMAGRSMFPPPPARAQPS